MSRICRDVEVDWVKHEIRIEGVPFPFYVEEDPQVDVIDGMIAVLRVGLFADSIRVITAEPDSGRLDVMDRAWIKTQVHNIVEERLADTLAWLRAAGHQV